MQDKQCLHRKIEEISYNIYAIPTKQIPMNHFAKVWIPGIVIVNSEFLCLLILYNHFITANQLSLSIHGVDYLILVTTC